MSGEPVANDEPLVARVEVRRTERGDRLGCCSHPGHQGAPLLLLIDGEWHGDASCDDLGHLGESLAWALGRRGLDLTPVSVPYTGNEKPQP